MERLIERISFAGAEFIEEDGHRTVKNVVMLGPVSQHGYEYEQPAMAKAVRDGLYEDCRIFINHEQGNRNLMDLAGVFKNTRHEGGKVRGDAHLLDDDFGRKFFNIAKTMPEAAGCSHVADGKLVTKNGKRVVEEITKVHSVDLVVQGATTRSVFESAPERAKGPRPRAGEKVGDFISRCVVELKDGSDHERRETCYIIWNNHLKSKGESAAESEGNIPKPAPKERQFEFMARCVSAVKGQYGSLDDEGATAMCFCAWQSRFEPGGMTDQPVTPASSSEAATDLPRPQEGEAKEDFLARCQKALKAEDSEITDDLAASISRGQWKTHAQKQDTNKKESGERPEERTSKMDLSKKLDAIDDLREQTARLADPVYADTIREHQREEEDREFEQRKAQRRDDRRRLEQINTNLSQMIEAGGRESDAEFDERCKERRRVREEREHRAVEIAESALGGVGTIIE